MSIKHKSRQLRKSMTDAEKKLWEYLRAHRFHGLHFRRQYPVGHRYILDFYCAKVKIGVEVDGPIHQSFQNKEYDAHRSEALGGKGIRILRFTNEQILTNIDWVLLELLKMTNSPLHIVGRGLGGGVKGF